MKIFIGVTDDQWFAFLKDLKPDEVNFWRPRSTANLHVIRPGELFLFKLHSPNNFIVGGGFLIRHLVLRASFAWDAFERKNGAPNREVFLQSLGRLRRDEPQSAQDPEIGCTMLAQPFFWDRADWIEVPGDWSRNIVSGKTYDSSDPAGSRLYSDVQDRLQAYSLVATGPSEGVSSAAQPRYGSPVLVAPRLGQGAFRALVTEAYGRTCALTGDHTLPVLQAAHIKPYSEAGPHEVPNGLLIRSDLHILFDRHYLTLSPDYRIEVSKRLKEDFQNGRIYYDLAGQPLKVLPKASEELPSQEFLGWHRERFIA